MVRIDSILRGSVVLVVRSNPMQQHRHRLLMAGGLQIMQMVRPRVVQGEQVVPGRRRSAALSIERRRRRRIVLVLPAAVLRSRRQLQRRKRRLDDGVVGQRVLVMVLQLLMLVGIMVQVLLVMMFDVMVTIVFGGHTSRIPHDRLKRRENAHAGGIGAATTVATGFLWIHECCCRLHTTVNDFLGRVSTRTRERR